MSRVQNQVGFVRGVGLLTSGLILGALLAPPAATAQLYGAGRNNSAVVIDEDVLGSLGGAGARPGVGVGFLPAPPAAPRSKINQVPPPKVKAAPPPPVVATPETVAPAPAPVAPPPEAAPVAASAPPAPLTVSTPVAAQPQTPRPDPGPPPVPGPAPAPVEPPPAPKVAVAAPPPPPAPAPAATPVVAVPSPTMSDKGARLLFLPDSADIPTTARPTLESIVKLVQSQQERRILITAYAAGTPETASQARRLSLNRALTVRSFLAEKGVSTARVDVRALGGQVADGPADRVDLELTAP